jgi:uncharacterized protein YijF (DUF1287 family)
MRRFLVRSTAVRSLGYDRKALRLDVEYPSGEVYRYEGVPPEEVVQMMRSESLGRFINFRIKPHYRYSKLEH